MQNNRFKSALDFEGKVLASYRYKINAHDRLLHTIKSALPENLSKHALYCVISDKKVSLYTDSAVWSSQLRFYHKAILNSIIDSKFGRFELLKIKVIPSAIEQQITQTSKPRTPSAENIANIFNQANNQNNNDALKTALLKLATTFKKLSN